MSVNTTMVAVTSANASIAASNAQRAKIERCIVEMQSYNPSIATTAQMQSYADCVNTLHPRVASPFEVLFMKAIIVVAALGLVGGIWYGRKEKEGWAISVGVGVACGLLAPIMLALLGLLVKGLVWVVMG